MQLYSTTDRYYDLKDARSEAECSIPVIFATSASGLGVTINPHGGDLDVPEGFRTRLPLWLTISLAASGEVEPKFGKDYGTRRRTAIDIGAASENLSRTPFYYTVADKLSEIIPGEEIPKFLHRAFKVRHKELLTEAYSGSQEADARQSLLTEEEKVLYESGKSAIERFHRWRATGCSALQSSCHLKKRIIAVAATSADRNVRQKM